MVFSSVRGRGEVVECAAGMVVGVSAKLAAVSLSKPEHLGAVMAKLHKTSSISGCRDRYVSSDRAMALTAPAAHAPCHATRRR